MTMLSARLSALAIFADVVADAMRRFHAGELDADGYVAVLGHQGWTPRAARVELCYQAEIKAVREAMEAGNDRA